MTIIKQRAVNGKGHQQNLRAYINDDRKVLLRDSQNLDGCANIKRWATFMEITRRRFGHDKASRRVRDKKTGELKQAQNTIMYHQIVAFNADECDINGGKLSPEDCMCYAKEYAGKYYPNQQVVFALHNEYCKEDKTHRYAVHMVINRSNIETGKRLNEGRGQKAKVERAKRIRQMDTAWDLKQVEKDERNSAVHKKQPSKIEREMAGRGVLPYKTNLRELCRLAAERARNIYEYRDLLEEWGVETEFRRGRMYATDTDNARYSFSVARLDADLNPDGLEQSFLANTAASIHETGARVLAEQRAEAAERERIAGIKEAYLADIREAYTAYRKMAHGMEGTELKDFPKLKLKRPPEEIADDKDVKGTVLAYWRGGDELRVEMASAVPYARRKAGGASGSGSQQNRSAQSMEKAERTQGQSKER